jgi:methionyl aminopeptidase
MVELKTDSELAVMREAGRVVATALAVVRAKATVGVSLTELDGLAADVLVAADASSSFQHYHPHFAPTPFPAVICASVNDVIVHGIPSSYRLQDGDLVSIDFGACVDGFHGDAAISFTVGTANPSDVTLIETTQAALDAGIAAARAGGRLGDISNAVGTIGRRAGYGIPEGFGGHGVGRKMHEDPSIPNEGQAGRGLPLRVGLVIAIEPMFLASGQDPFTVDADGWALRTADGSRAAHIEHTVAVTSEGPVILTAP